MSRTLRALDGAYSPILKRLSCGSLLLVETVGISRRQGSSSGCAGAAASLTAVFRVSASAYTRIRTHLIILNVGSIPSFHQTTKEGPLDPLCCLVETVGIEPTSKNISGRTSPSAAGFLFLPAGRHAADSMQTIPLGPLTLTGGRVRGFLHA